MKRVQVQTQTNYIQVTLLGQHNTGHKPSSQMCKRMNEIHHPEIKIIRKKGLPITDSSHQL